MFLVVSLDFYCKSRFKSCVFTMCYISSGIANNTTIPNLVVAGGMNMTMTPEFYIGVVKDKIF